MARLEDMSEAAVLPRPAPRLGVGHVARAVLAVALALAALLGLQGAGLARAAGLNFVVDDTSDGVDSDVGDGECRTSVGTCTLRAAIQQANALSGADTILVPSGTYALQIPPQGENGIATGDLDITDSLTIRGAGAGSTIVDGGTPRAGAPPEVRGLDRLFEVQVGGGAVTFSGLTLSDGYAAEYGGAILNSSSATVTVIDSILTGSAAGKTGGAIDNHVGGTVRVQGSTVSSNYAVEGGSAVNNNLNGVLELTNSTVSANSAAAVGLDETLRGAGAIANNAEHDEAGMIIVIESQISDNRAGGGRSGSGIWNKGAGTVTVERTTFSKNRADGDGGAIYNGTGEVTVNNSTFFENAAKGGGAIASTGGVVDVLESSFSKNSAVDWGGGILNSNLGGVTIRDSSFSENTALTGGGFANEGTGLVTVESSTFAKNSAVDTVALSGGEGGGMHSNSGGEVVVTGGSFTENKAHAGGGFSNEGGGRVTITGTWFSANLSEEQGGGILVQGGDVRMVNIDVVGNVSESLEEGGGGISYAGDKSTSIGESAAIEDSRIRDNKSKSSGGGIDSRGDGPLLITTTAITGNTAAVGGAIHHVGDATLAVTRSTLSGNFAESGGGVLTDGDGEATVENTTVSGNRAGQFGGGFLVSSRLTIRNTTVINNLAASGGGIDNGGGPVSDGFVFLANSIVANNPAGGNCAGTMTSRGGNVENADSCQLRESSDQPGTDPRLGPLAGNGGPTQTHALLADSPAQDKAVCTEMDPCPPVDQRGFERPRFAGFDVGAYESELAPGGGGTPQCAARSERLVLSDFDSWVSQASPGDNFGSDGILNVASQSGGNERALVHFTLPPVPPGCKLVGATLRLYAPSATDGRTLQALRVASDWSEPEVTWSNQPATAGPAATTGSGLGFREWDVHAQTLDMYTFGDHGFLLRDAAENGSGSHAFHSRERSIDRPPELMLVFDDLGAPPPTGVCPEVPQLLSADRDSWVSQGSPSNNSGMDSTLKVKSQSGSNSRALVRFPLPALPPGCTTVSSATLRLEASSAKEGHTLQALQVASPWSETGVTWSNQPSTSGPATTTPSGHGALQWDVTEQTLGIYVQGNHGFLIRDATENGNGDEQVFNSREKVDGSPELVFVFDDSTPETTIESGPVSPIDETDATFTFLSDRDDATFECSLDGAAFQPCTSPHAIAGLAEGDHGLEVRATRRVRAVDPTPASYAWAVAIPPETTVAGPASPSTSPSATLTFSSDDPDATFECSRNGEPFAACTSPVQYANLADGRQEFRARAVDPFGNVDPTPGSHVWTVAVPPETTITDQPADPSNSASASFVFSGSDNGTAPSELVFECKLDAAPFTACVSPQAYTALADGSHTFQVRATDLAGITDPEPAASTWTIDTLAPVTSIDSGPADLSNDPSPAFAFSSNENGASFACKLDSGEWASCTSPHGYDALADGVHGFQVRATDPAGNTDATPASYTWTVDTVAPAATIDTGPPALGNSASASFGFTSSEAGSSFQCALDEAAFTACTSPQQYTALGDGTHTFAVRATDAAGNTDATAASYTWTVDTTAPQTSINAGPPELSNSTSASFSFSSSEAGFSFECSLDAGAFTACTSPQQYTALGDGTHTFAVRATDAAGNTDATAASYTWTVDTTSPQTSINAGPPALTNGADASFHFSAGEEDSSFECALDEAAFTACTSPQQYNALADGTHTFQVRATDPAGNTDATAATHAWTVDTTAPQTSIDTGPPALSNSANASFRFSAGEEGSSFECALDTGAFAACTSPRDYTALADGTHTFHVRATDPAGNTDATSATYTWAIDTVAPATSIDTGPPALSSSANASFDFRSSEEGSSFECALDAGTFAPCTPPAEYAALGDGSHSFSVRATDPAGNTDATAASHTWTVDTSPPNTTVTAAPPSTTTSTSASFSFTSNEAGSSFQCALDGSAFAACTSPREYSALALGTHTFQVRATDPAGNTDPTPANHTWTIQPSPGCPGPITSVADADSWIDQNSPSNNKGTDSILKIQSKGPADNFRALVRFALPTGIPQGCVIASATLRLYAAGAKTGRTLNALRIADGWSENLVTWSNQPDTTGAAAAIASGTGYREWNVTSQVQAMYDTGSNNGFLIRDAVEGADAEQQLHSREKGENPPSSSSASPRPATEPGRPGFRRLYFYLRHRAEGPAQQGDRRGASACSSSSPRASRTAGAGAAGSPPAPQRARGAEPDGLTFSSRSRVAFRVAGCLRPAPARSTGSSASRLPAIRPRR